MVLPFADRTVAGRLLGERLLRELLPGPLVVVALPRGGVPVALEVAHLPHAPMDVLFVRKIGAPWQRELAVAAVVGGERPDIEIDEQSCAATGASRAHIEREADAAWREIERRRQAHLQGRAAPDQSGTTAILVDDGIATGTTVRAAVKALRRRGAARVVLAVPVAAHETLMALHPLCDRIVCLAEPQPFRSVGLHYLDFHQLSDAEVIAALDAATPPASAAPMSSPR